MEKSKNLCFIFAVLSAIVLAFFIVAFHSVNVSAAENNSETYSYTVTLKNRPYNGSGFTGDYWLCTENPIVLNLNYRIAFLLEGSSGLNGFFYLRNDTLYSWDTCQYFGGKTFLKPDGSTYTMDSGSYPSAYINFSTGYVYSGNYDGIPRFSNRDAMIAYLSSGDDSGRDDKIDYENLTDSKPLFADFVDFDFNDTDTNYLRDFRLEGFKSDYFINASWTSVHIPDKLQQWIDKGTVDMDDVAVMVMFTYRNKSYPETESYVKYYPTLINANNLEATIKVSDFQPEFDTYYLADVAFIPIVEFTYYNSGMGTSMQPLNLMYYGSMNHVYFKFDGSVGGANFDSGDINGDKDGGFALGDDTYNGLGGITGDITDALAQFSALLDSLSGSLSRVAKFASIVFSWLPSWAYLLIGGAVAVCFLLRIAGR